MTPEQIQAFIVNTYDDVHPKTTWGETSFFVNPGKRLPSGSYFATLKQKDGENDKASSLDRDQIFRLNFGPGRAHFEQQFGPPPDRPAKGGIVAGPWDFEALNTLMPHPVYGWMSWICILNPDAVMFKRISPLLDAAYQKAEKSAREKLRKLAIA